MEPAPELEIIKEIVRGDVRKYALLVDRYKDRGLSLALRILGNREESEEILQDAFLRAFHGLRDFRAEAKFSTWFYRILYNLCMTRVSRRRQRFDLFDALEDVENVLSARDETPDPLESLEDRELAERLAVEVERLPERFRIPLTLYYTQELRYEEISELMRQPLGTVKTNLFRAKVILRKRVLKVTGKEVIES